VGLAMERRAVGMFTRPRLPRAVVTGIMPVTKCMEEVGRVSTVTDFLLWVRDLVLVIPVVLTSWVSSLVVIEILVN
jgi:hypothetical protein